MLDSGKGTVCLNGIMWGYVDGLRRRAGYPAVAKARALLLPEPQEVGWVHVRDAIAGLEWV